MYKCTECGAVFEEPKTWWESRGEFGGSPCSEEMSGCPNCGECGYEEAEQCEFCEKYFLEDELHGGVCEDCIKERSDFNTCYEIGANNPETIEINGLLMSMFSVTEIESILKNILIERGLTNCQEYINVDVEWFGEQLVKGVKP